VTDPSSGLDELPAYEDLSEEQDDIYNLPLDGNFLVSGPPGTGKSVMALYRAEALTFDDRSPSLLMFNNVLKQYTEAIAGTMSLDGRIQTFHSWFDGFWRRTYGGRAPKIGSDLWAFDWPTILSRFVAETPDADTLADLIVDEGQDLSTQFYAIANRIALNITVFADENQQLQDDNSTLAEIEKKIRAQEHLKLRRNYRNSVEIARLAAQFYSGSPTGIPDVPGRSWKPGPRLTRYESTNDLVEEIARYALNHGNLRIGVAVRFSKRQKSLYNRLLKRGVSVETYISKDQAFKKLNFGRPGVQIVNYMSLKGLQFDTLFVPDLQLEDSDVTSARVRMKYYVILSRARNELYLSYEGDSEPALTKGISSTLLSRA